MFPYIIFFFSIKSCFELYILFICNGLSYLCESAIILSIYAPKELKTTGLEVILGMVISSEEPSYKVYAWHFEPIFLRFETSSITVFVLSDSDPDAGDSCIKLNL